MPPKCSGRSDLERSSLSQANAEATAAVDGIRLRARAAPVEEPLYARLATRIKVSSGQVRSGKGTGW
jgi:class 3 adenylate cyclase